MYITEDWQSINSVENIVVGDRFKIHNTGRTPVILKNSTTLPSDETNSLVLDYLETITVNSGSDTIWVKTLSSAKGHIYASSERTFDFGDNGVDTRVYTGDQAFTVQAFVEANVKKGTEFEASNYIGNFGALSTVDTVFTTGPSGAIIKAFAGIVDGAGITITLYKNPTYTGGVDLTSEIYNPNTVSTNTSEFTILGGVTTSSVGTQVGPTLYELGSIRTGGQSIATSGVIGLDRVLAPNTTYLRRIVSLDQQAQRVSLYSTWYEGPTSIDTF